MIGHPSIVVARVVPNIVIARVVPNIVVARFVLVAEGTIIVSEDGAKGAEPRASIVGIPKIVFAQTHLECKTFGLYESINGTSKTNNDDKKKL